jgi:hypothetical protein
MRKTAGYTHYWTVRGQGFTDKQWRALLSITVGIISNALESGIAVAGADGTGEPDLTARSITLNGPADEMGEPFRFVKTADPAWGKCKTLHQPYDAVVVSILTAAKKIAPDILEVNSDGGRDIFKRIFAMSQPNLFAKTVKLATTQPALRPQLLPAILKHASVNKTAQRRFLVAYAHQNPEFRDELVRRLDASRGIVALEFDTQDALNKYKENHKVNPGTKLEVKKKDDKGNKDEKAKADTKDKAKGAVGEKNLGEGAEASQVHGNAVVHGNAKITGKAEVGDHAVVYDNAKISDDAKVGGDAEIRGSAKITGKAQVDGNAQVAGRASVGGTTEVSGKAKIGGSAKINAGKFDGDVVIVGGSWEGIDVSHGQWKGPKGPEMVKEKNLKDEDVDAVLEQVVNKKGMMLSPAELMRKFLAEAKPETRERMKGMSPAEFMEIVSFMVDDEEADAGMKGKTASATTSGDALLFTAALRVASTTKDPVLRRQLAMILRDAKQAQDTDGEKDAKFEEGSHPSDAEITKGMSPEEKAAWMKNKGQVQNKGAAQKTAAQKLAAKLFPKTPVKIAEKWIQDAVKRPGRVREYLNVPEGQDIPMGKLDAAITKVKGSGDHSLLSALVLAKRLKKMGATKAA